MLALDRALAFDADATAKFLEALPAKPAVVLIEPRTDLPGARPLLLRTADLRRRLRLLLGPRDPAAKRVHLASYAGGIRFRLTGSAFEQSLAHYQQARAMWPREYRRRMRFRPPALIKLTQANAYPRAYVTRRAAAGGVCYGPFASRRAAEFFLESFLDLFRLRRCQIKILRDPAFPGCIYSEMKMCLAPCFGGCSVEEYSAEASRAAAFLDTGGASMQSALEGERETASANLDFERAALLHRGLEKAEAARRSIPEIARSIQTLNAAILQRGAEEGTIAVFVVRAGRIADPFALQFTELASPRSVEEILRAALEPSSPVAAVDDVTPASDNSPDIGRVTAPVITQVVEPVNVAAGDAAGAVATGAATPEGDARVSGPANASSTAETEDHLALLARWFYAKPRHGEIFFADSGPRGWPYRRMLRACSRLLTAPGSSENP